MRLKRNRFNRDDRQWPMLVLLSLIVLLSSATVLWLVGVAVRNERAAIRQSLVDAYRQQLELAAAHVDEHWSDIDRQCNEFARVASPSESFASCVKAQVADSLLVVGPGGSIRYPAESIFQGPANSRSLNADAWNAAAQLEFVEQKFQVAAEAYGAIADVELNASASANARLAQARCLCKCNRQRDATELLTKTFDTSEMQSVVDQDGRSPWVTAQLRLLELTGETKDTQDPITPSSDFDDRLRLLRGALSDYQKTMLSSQRVFAMHEVQAMSPHSPPFSTLPAEEFAAEVSEEIRTERTSGSWNLNQDDRCLPLRNTPVVLLFKNKGVTARTNELLAKWQTDAHSIRLVAGDISTTNSDALAVATLDTLPRHRLALTLNDALLDNTLREQTLTYVIAGIFTVASIAIIATLVGFFVSKQLRLAALKNDLVAIVAHELRTPLASSRVLVDTLIDRDDGDQQQREYLQLIAGENERLTRLVDNFLSFSRLEKGDGRFQFEAVAVSDIVDRAVAATRTRMLASQRNLTIKIAEDLPTLNADADALVTVLINLLENAIKFTSDDGEIALSVEQSTEDVVFAVRDDGIGMNPRNARRAFDKFYQADARLSRSHDGCGLGLSLVKSIAEAHGGSVEVESKLDVGSAFRVRLPATKGSPISNHEGQK